MDILRGGGYIYFLPIDLNVYYPYGQRDAGEYIFYLFLADIMTLGDVISFHVKQTCQLILNTILYSLCHVRSLTFVSKLHYG